MLTIKGHEAREKKQSFFVDSCAVVYSFIRQMRYVSTRGGGGSVPFSEAIRCGYAPDQGLFVPEQIPNVTAHLQAWSSLSFQDLCTEVLHLWIGPEMSKEKLHQAVVASFAEFSVPEIVPVKQIDGIFVAELFHGPTLAFKDFGQQILCKILDYFAVKEERNVTVIVSTTGDTGPAAIRAASDSQRLKIVCFYPKGQISRLQELQMTTVDSPNVSVIAFEGGGDDMDGPIKLISTDVEFREKHGISSANSINWGRVAAQCVHWFYAYFSACRIGSIDVGSSINFSVPTGAMGNVTAGFVAYRMGLPVGRFLCGVNANDIVHRTFTRGEFHKAPMCRTLSEAINIQVPYNMERIFYYASDGNVKLVREAMACMESTEKLTITDWPVFSKIQDLFLSSRVNDEEMLKTIQYFFEKHDYMTDPHTAVALNAVQQHFSIQQQTPQTSDLNVNNEAKLLSGTCEPGTRPKNLFSNIIEQHTTNEERQKEVVQSKEGRPEAKLKSVKCSPSRFVTSNEPMVVLATAHACKFKKAVTAAFGCEFWGSKFVHRFMPKNAAALTTLPEVGGAPAGKVFRANEDWSLRLRNVLESFVPASE